MSIRDSMLADVRRALRREAGDVVPPVPGRIAPRDADDPEAEMERLLIEIGKVGGKAVRLHQSELREALARLVEDEGVRKATLWQTEGLRTLGMEQMLRSLGVEIVAPQAGKHLLAECDLGITTVDAALPETGSLLLRSSPEQPRAVSLLPRVHLAVITPAVLRPDLGPAFEEVKGDGYWVLVTGPSRTADIELTVTIGVHGPKALYVWSLEADAQ